jgi:hypothetical protein
MPRILASIVPLLVGTAAAAQQASPGPLAHSSVLPAAVSASPQTHLAARLPAAGAHAPASTGRTLLFTAGGSFLGAWMGYVASQVARSDWDKHHDGEFSSYRTRFAVGGAVGGGVVGALLGHHSRPRVILADARNEPGPAHAAARGDAIRAEELAGINARDAYDIIARLRPTWLRARGQETAHDTPNGYTEGTNSQSRVVITSEASGGIKVYLDETLLGGIETLHEVAAVNVTGAEFITPAEATYRWGGGVSQGVIRLTTRPM